MKAFERLDDGLLSATFTDLEVELIVSLATQVAGLLAEHSPIAAPASGGNDLLAQLVGIGGGEEAPADPAIARLLPDAYRDDDSAATDFRRWTEHGLAARKIANAQVVIESLVRGGGVVELTAAETQSWLRAITDIRLTLASRLGIESDDDLGEADHDDDAIMMRDVYDWLAFVQESLLHALQG